VNKKGGGVVANLAKAVLLAACGAFAMQAAAQPSSYPNRPLRLVVAFPPGSVSDTLARSLAGPLGASLGQPVVVENKAGADGMIAGEQVAKSAPDGYTLFLTSSSVLTANPHLKKRVPYALADFSPITKLGEYTFVLSVHPSVPAMTLQELFSYGRANPDRLSYATGNITGFLVTAQLAALGKVSMVQVPYKGESLAIPDLLAGRVQLLIGTIGVLAPHVREGKLRALAVLGSRRSTLLPEVPTFAEEGLPPFPVTPAAGIFGPAKLPADIVERLNREINAVLSRSDVREQFERQAFQIDTSTPGELGNFMRSQYEAWGRAAREVGIKPE
jgi:tripartite-type tricarboxylate transporter receptor subunit TctC